jgi:hypothetical protein
MIKMDLKALNLIRGGLNLLVIVNFMGFYAISFLSTLPFKCSYASKVANLVVLRL